MKEADRAKTLSQADPAELCEELRSRGYLVDGATFATKDFSVKGDIEAYFAMPEHEYTTTQRFIIYNLEEGDTKDGKGPPIIYPAREGGAPWELYDTQRTAFSQAVGPVSQTNRVLYVWTWVREGKQHP